MVKRQRKENSWWGRIKILFGLIALSILLTATVAALYAAYVFRETQKTVQSLDSLVDYQPGGVTQIFATDKDPKTGQPILLGEVYGKYREYVPVEKIPEIVKDATIAIEDERFYEHSGVDLWAIGRAMYRNVTNGRMSEGASTLTQQLTRNLILNDKRKTVSRKLQEIMLSVEIEKNFSKEQILEMYLNEVYYGSRAYGIQAASKVYFNKPLDKLTLAEAALLAGLPQRPVAFDPFRNLEAAVRRRNVVLTKMGQLNPEKSAAVKTALTEKPKIAPEPDPENTNFKAAYFTNYILRLLKAKYGREAIYNNGFKVYTTLNYSMQIAAQKAITAGVYRGRDQGITEAALVSIEPKTGYIRAMVGGLDWDKDQFNNVTQGRRQPGSTFKPIVYAAAFETGKYDPYYMVSNDRVNFRGYSPRNDDADYGGEVSIRNALINSINIPAVRVCNDIGPRKVIDVARRLGIESKLEASLPLALGASEVSPLEMAGAYSVFANGGNFARPMAIIRVVDAEGATIENNAPQVTKQVIPESVAVDISSMLRGVVLEGTGKMAANVPDAHGKTGTTSERRDIWFSGYTPELTTIVWACGKRMRMVTRNGQKVKRAIYESLDQGSFGGTYCAPIWSQFMLAAVPIQQTYKETLRVAPENVVPSNADVKAKLASDGKPEASKSDARSSDSSSREINIPRATPAPEQKERDSDESSRRESRPEPRSDTSAESERTATPTPEPTPRHESEPSSDSEDEKKVTVELCPDSGKLATRWCPERVSRTIAPSLVPKTYCKSHSPRPGDGA
jgi:1A family penicillin-binding protein